jgi:Flagellar hook-length control protein FliK
MTTTPHFPKLNISASIERKILPKRGRQTPPEPERERGFASALEVARGAKSRQNIAAISGKKGADQKSGLRSIVRHDDLQTFKLGPRVRIIAPDAPPPDEQSLLDFARSQGVDEDVITLIIATSDAESTGRQPDLAGTGTLADPLAQSAPTIAGENGATTDDASTNALSPPDSTTAALASGLPPPSWLTEGMRSGTNAPLTGAAVPFTYNNETTPNTNTSETAKPSLLNVKGMQTTPPPPAPNEQISCESISSKFQPNQSTRTQGDNATAPALSGSIAHPMARTESSLDGALLVTSADVLATEKGALLLKQDRFEGATSAAPITENEINALQEVAETATADVDNPVVHRYSSGEKNLLPAPSGQALPGTESVSIFSLPYGKKQRDPGVPHSAQVTDQTAAAPDQDVESQAPLAGSASKDATDLQGNTQSNELHQASSTGAAPTPRANLSTSSPLDPAISQDAAFLRTEKQQLLSDQVSAAVGQRISAEIAKGTWQFDLQLHPAHLGNIQIRLGRKAGAAIDAEFSASESATKDLLVAGLPKLKEVMALAGLELNSLNVRQDTPDPRDNPAPRDFGSAASPVLASPSESRAAAPLGTRTDYIRADGLDVTV